MHPIGTKETLDAPAAFRSAAGGTADATDPTFQLGYDPHCRRDANESRSGTFARLLVVEHGQIVERSADVGVVRPQRFLVDDEAPRRCCCRVRGQRSAPRFLGTDKSRGLSPLHAFG
jgi:hypothetical protein